MQESPYTNKTWEFLMTPILFLTAGLVWFISWVSPTGYEVIFSVRALSEEELDEYERIWYEEDDDDY